MTLEERIGADLRDAQKAGEMAKVSTLRLLVAAIKNETIAKRKTSGEALPDEEVSRVLQREAKKRREAAGAFRAGGRDDLRRREEEELAILNAYLPEMMTETEIRAVLQATAAEGHGTVGALIKAAMPKFAGRADGRLVSDIAKQILGA